MKQEFDNYTAEDHLVWKTLFNRQKENLQTKAVADYLNGLSILEPVLHAESIPDFSKLNDLLSNKTGWTIEVVPGLIPVEEFFELLSQRKFPSSTWLRKMDQLDYLEEPDMFHDIFGHIPLLAIPEYADAMQKFGKLGVNSIDDPQKVLCLQRLYWFTIEFGLVLENGSKKIYGAGLASSFGESNKAIKMEKCAHQPFNLTNIIGHDFVNNSMQNSYYVLGGMEDLIMIFQTKPLAEIELTKIKPALI